MENWNAVISDPKNRGEQVDSSCMFIFRGNTAYFESLSNRPARLRSAAVELVMQDLRGYHFKVVRTALQELDTNGVFDVAAPPYTHEELYA